ncbi:MAG: DUF2752 domain-containing protein [Lachnospiraceae bacterium]
MSHTKRIKTPEDGLFIAGWLILAAILILLIIKNLFFSELVIIELMKPCYIYSMTGFYCPGCGGSRSVAALLHGRFFACAVNYPLTAYAAVMYTWFMVSQTIQRVSRNRIRIGLRWRSGYLWAALGILIVHFVVKNIFCLVTGMVPFVS